MKRKAVLLCAAAALLALVPYTADMAEMPLPVWFLFALLPLSEGLHYMAVFFHEPGHALCHWLFGAPALPTLDTVHGGGMTYSLGRSYALTIFIYALMISGILLLVRKKNFRAAGVLTGFTLLHAALISTGWDLFVTLVMGHGTEMIAGSVMIALVFARPDILKTLPERYVALTTGLYFMGRNAVICAGLFLSAAKRREYAMQKGIPGLGDYQHAADVIGVSVETVAVGMMVFLTVTCLLAFDYIHRHKT